MLRAPITDDGSGVPAEPAVVLLDGAGGVAGATARATRLLARAAMPAEVPWALRSLAGRARHQRGLAYASLPASGGARLVLRAASAGAFVAVTIDSEAGGDRELPGELTVREREVVRLTLRGLPTKRIALELGISPWTVTAHLRSIYDKCGVSSRAELAALALGAAGSA